MIAIDGGTQSTKVFIFDTKGNVISEGRQTLRPMQAPQVGWAEHPDDDLWDSLICACKEALSKFSGNVQDIIGVGLCTIRCCRAFLRKDGSLAYPVIDWMDPRAYGPFVFPEGVDDIAYATTTTGYMTHKLTGEFKDTAGNCIYYQWPTSPATWEWSDDDAFAHYNLSRSQMLELKMPGDILGHVTKKAAAATGIPEGIPVVATSNDKAVEALGTGLMVGNGGLLSLGTYTTAMVKDTGLIKNMANLEANAPQHYYPNFGCVPNVYLFEICKGIHRGMWTISWMSELLGGGIAMEAAKRGISPIQLLGDEAGQVPAGSEGLITVPDWLVTYADFKKGIMIGFDVRHGRAHMFRSLMEGIVLRLYNGFSDMCGETGVAPDRLIASGGGSKGGTFVQIIADVFGLPVERNTVEDAAGVGAAICAAVGTGIYHDFEAATNAMVHIRDVHQPNMENHALYMRMNDDVFRHITQVTDPLLEKAFPIFN